MRSICIIGVDGTGKSSLVKMIVDRLGEDKSTVQYMGSKQWETRIARSFHKPGKASFIRSLLCSTSVVIDMYKRVYKHLFSNKIVVFDRYVDELYLNLGKGEGSVKNKFKYITYYVIFKILFYRPSLIFYLTCPVEVSVSRKDDIVTKEETDRLRERKLIYDSYYLEKSFVKTIDTQRCGLEQALDIVMKEINNI